MTGEWRDTSRGLDDPLPRGLRRGECCGRVAAVDPCRTRVGIFPLAYDETVTGFVPTPIAYATNIVLDLTQANLRTLVLSGPATLRVPGRSTNRVEWVRVDLLAGTNAFAVATSNVTGFSAVTISSNGWTSLYFSGKGTTNGWEVVGQ